MPTDLLLKEIQASAVTVTSTGASVADKTAVSAGTIDLRSGGTTGLAQAVALQAELTCQFATVTGIAQNTVIADIYLVPSMDNGSTYGTVDTTSGSSNITSNCRVGSFTCSKAPTAATNQQYPSSVFDSFPDIYTVYLLYRAGQTVTVNWTLKIFGAKGQSV